MARLRDAWSLVKESVSAWIHDSAPSMGAALAYYSLFSIAPLLLIAITIAGLFFGEAAAQGEVLEQLRGLVGAQGAATIEGLLRSVSQPGNTVIGMVTGGFLLIVGATTAFAELQRSLDRIWDAPPSVRPSGIVGLVRSRLLSLGLVAAVGFLVTVSLLASAAIAALARWWSGWFGEWAVLLRLANQAMSFLVITGMFGLIYKFLPSVRIAWRDVWIGAAVTSLLFAIGKFAIGYYLGTSSVASGFGAAASIVVLLVWVYYSAQIFLLGAEFTWVYAHRRGSRSQAPTRTDEHEARESPRAPVAGIELPLA